MKKCLHTLFKYLIVFVFLASSKTFAYNYLDIAWQHYHAQNYSNAVAFFNLAAEQKPNDAKILQGLAYTYFRLGRSDISLDLALKADKFNAQLPPISELIYFPGYFTQVHVIGDTQSLIGWSHYFLGTSYQALR